MAEDRGLEPQDQLLKLCQTNDIYSRLICTLCQKADDKYNSGLFHFNKENGIAEPPDTITKNLIIDDKVIKPIIQGLYFEHGSPYQFDVLPVEILGTVYERFLGKVIRLTSAHQAKIEDKPEVRKAGGVYYTPSYIVDYIVSNTLCKQIEGKSPSSLAGSKTKSPFRVLDMSCGSGSFLLGAYQFFLDHCLKWYIEHDPESRRKPIYQDSKGMWKLTIGERKRILTTHIFGVDIDKQAVEVTKLALLLKALEGVSDSNLMQQGMLFEERVLPNLSDNIKHGNSLISTNYFEYKLIPIDSDLQRINPFNWESEFSDAMKAGGFDCIIGNPPYIRIQALKEWAPLEVNIYKELYLSSKSGNYDIYVVFVERALNLLNNNGIMGYILPHKFFNAKYGASLRKLISTNKHLSSIVHFGDQQIFEGATTYTCLLFLTKCESLNVIFSKIDNLDTWKRDPNYSKQEITSSSIGASEWNIHTGPDEGLFNKLSALPITLGSIADRIAQGIRTSANEVYVLDIDQDGPRVMKARSKILERTIKVEKNIVARFLQGRDIKRYMLINSGKVVIIPYHKNETSYNLINENEMQETYPNSYEYLRNNKSYLQDREQGRMHGHSWYGYIYPKNIDIMKTPKILVPDIADRASYALDETGEFAFTSGYGITLKNNVNVSNKYILGLLNSKLLNFYLKRISTTMRGGFFRYFTQYLEKLPIVLLDISKQPERVLHDQVVECVDKMLSLIPKYHELNTNSEQSVIKKTIISTDQHIDTLVYNLYNLTPEEINIIEGNK